MNNETSVEGLYVMTRTYTRGEIKENLKGLSDQSFWVLMEVLSEEAIRRGIITNEMMESYSNACPEAKAAVELKEREIFGMKNS